MKDLIICLWNIITPKEKIKFYMVFFLTVVSSVFEVFSIGMVVPIITILINPDELMSYDIVLKIAAVFDINSSGELVLPVVIAFVLVAICTTIVRIFSIKISANFAFNLGGNLSVRAYSNIIHRDYLDQKKINSSEDVSRLVTKINTVIQSLIFPLLMLVSAVLMFFIISGVFLIIDFRLSFSVLFGLSLIYLAVTLYFKKNLRVNSYEIAKMQNSQVKIVQESSLGIRDIIISNSYEYFERIYTEIDKNLRTRQASNIVVAQAPRYLIETISIIFLIVVFYYFVIVNEYISKDMILPTFITIAVALQRILPIAQQAYRSWANIEGNKQSLIDVMSVLKSESSNLKSTKNKINFENKIEIRNLSFKYNENESYVLKDINLIIPKGARVGFIGETGSGKSTLIDIIMGLLVSNEGAVFVDGVALTKENFTEWHKNISHVPQSVCVLDDNFYNNVVFGSDNIEVNDAIKVEKSAKIACLDNFLSESKYGSLERLGENGSKLSGGQKQRVGIARCVYKDAQVIVLDEATSALDNQTEKQVMNNLYSLETNPTILIIAHRLTTLKECEYIVEMSNGRIINVGSYEEIIGD